MLQPTVNVTIDKVWDADEVVVKKEVLKESPWPPPTSPLPFPAPTPPSPAEIFTLIGASFGVGVVVGGMLVFAFSKCPAEA